MKKLVALLLTLVLTFALALSFGCLEPKGGVNVKYYKDGPTVVQMMNSGAETIGLVPEPAATNLEKAFAKKEKPIYRLDLQELYDSETKAYPQAVLMVKKSILTESLYNELKTSITESVVWAKEKPSNAVSAISGKFATTLNANTLSAEAIDGCKIYFEDATSAKKSVNQYIEDIRAIDESSAKVVNDDFFYSSATGSNIQDAYTFACPDGAPALAISKLINDGNNLGTGKTVNYEIVAPNMLGGDIVIMPLNIATKKYNSDEKDPMVCVAVITHGNFYIMSTEKITIDDLKDKQIAVPNMGAVPDWTIQSVLKNNGYEINVLG